MGRHRKVVSIVSDHPSARNSMFTVINGHRHRRQQGFRRSCIAVWVVTSNSTPSLGSNTWRSRRTKQGGAEKRDHWLAFQEIGVLESTCVCPSGPCHPRVTDRLCPARIRYGYRQRCLASANRALALASTEKMPIGQPALAAGNRRFRAAGQARSPGLPLARNGGNWRRGGFAAFRRRAINRCAAPGTGSSVRWLVSAA